MAVDIGMMTNAAGVLNVMAESALYYAIYNLLPAIFFLVIGFFVSSFAGQVLTRIMDALKVEEVFVKYRVEDALGGNQLSPMLATVAKWYVMLLFLTAAVEALQLNSVNWLINAALMYAPVLMGVGLLIIVSAIVGEWVREAILDLHKFYMQKTIAEGLKWIIVGVALVVSLDTVGFQMQFVREIIGILLQGLVYGIALAFGLAFGLGGQKDAAEMIKLGRKKLKF